MAPETHGYHELLLRSIIDGQSDLRQSLRRLDERMDELETRVISLTSSDQKPGLTGEPWRLVDRVLSIGPTLWAVFLWAWHAILWLVPGMLAGWGLVEGWWAIASRWFGAHVP